MIFELVKLQAWRDNLWMQINGTDVFRRVDEPGVQIEVNSTRGRLGRPHAATPSGSATTRGKPIEVEIRRTFARPRRLPQRAASRSSHDYQTVQIHADREAGQEGRPALRSPSRHQGRNAKQNNVTDRSTKRESRKPMRLDVRSTFCCRPR